jgi:ATP phosphoribosyltransferase regulatory subunit
MYGHKEILDTAKNIYSHIDTTQEYMDNLEFIVSEIEAERNLKLHIDLGEIQGFKYHNGIVFSAYTGSVGYVLAKGGRYDGLRKSSDQDRPAVGFDLDLIAVSNL